MASAVLVICILFSINTARAQLSGSYTIAPVGGSYSSFNAAVSDLTTKGVSGAVTFNVAPGTYTESITIGPITGASSKNTISFIGAGQTNCFIQNTNPVVYFNKGCTYVSFSQFSIANTGSSQAVYAYYCSYCSILNCALSATNTVTNMQVLYDDFTSHFTVSNNHISGGYFGVDIFASSTSSLYSNGVYSNNRFVNFSYYGCYAFSANQNSYTGNVFDSAATGGSYGFVSLYESGAVYNSNQVIAPALYYPLIVEYANYYSANNSFTVENNILSNFQYYTYFYLYYCSNILIAHNSIYGNSSNSALYMDIYYCSPNINVISNILYGGGSDPVANYNVVGSSFPDPFGELDGNAYVNATGGPTVYINGTTYLSLGAYKSAMSGLVYKSPYNSLKSTFENYSTNYLPTFISPPKNLHISQTALAPSGVYAGINVDIDGNPRCKLFPTAGAVESTYGKSIAPVSKFTLPKTIYPGSPTFVYSSVSPGDPVLSHWYVNGVHVSDSSTLLSSAFVKGSNCVKLVLVSCGGTDSSTQCTTVSAPTAVPASDFLADKNSIQTGDVVSFEDLSTNGPTRWLWTVSPDSVLSGGQIVPAIQYVFGSNTTQNPKIKFLTGGKFTICLTAYNSIGKGNNNCKTNYISAVTSLNLSSTPLVTSSAQGYLYDNGGPNGVYTYDPSNGYKETALIAPCADSIYLTINQFDLFCGYDFLRIYSGKNNKGTPLWKSACSSTGYSGFGPGYTGGLAYACSYQCMPNTLAPDTFKAKNSMYIEMVCAEAIRSQGFAAHWWSTPRKDTRPVAAFTTSNAGDSICANGTMYFYNKTQTSADDSATFLWDLDGDFADGFECIGACATTLWPYFLPGQVTVTLIATNCGGTDSAIQTITVFYPAKPKSAFSANNTTPTTNDIVFLTSNVVQCVDDYLWTVSKSNTGSQAAVTYVNGTTNQYQNPEINISDTGYFTVVLDVANTAGSNILTKSKYLFVRNAYCTPSVKTFIGALSISKVAFAGMKDSVIFTDQDYFNFANDFSLSASVAQGAPYKLSVSRDSNLIFDPINRDVYIDWNQDGSFVGPGEIVAQDSNSTSATFTKTITVPKTAKLGATIMRVAVNLGLYSNKPCGPNEFGEYQDYRIYVTPYNILPVITLKGAQGLKDTIYLEQGNQFKEPGYSASSLLYGNLTKKVVRASRQLGNSFKDTFNSLVPGVYLFSYNVTDSAGNKAITQYRIVRLTPDKTPPALIVALPDTIYVEVNSIKHPPIPKVLSAYDIVDGDLRGNVLIDSAIVQYNVVGVYKVSYSVKDVSGNGIVVYRYVDVIDTLKPVMTLAGPSPQKVEVDSVWKDPGVNISDVYYTQAQLEPLVKQTNNIDTTLLGNYTVTYRLTDPSGNKAVPVTRIVKVVDTIPPKLILIYSPDTVDVFQKYIDPGVFPIDNYDKQSDIVITAGGSYYTKFPDGIARDTGIYTIIYIGTDKSGNRGTVARKVRVFDPYPPTIQLIGETSDVTVNVCRWAKYKDLGYTVSDPFYPVNTIKIDTFGSYFQKGHTSIPGKYDIYYRATNKSGKSSQSDPRTINVYPETDVLCISGIAPGLDLDKSVSVFPNPNSGVFTINANLAPGQNVKMTLTDILGKQVAVVQDGQLFTNSFRVDLGTQASGIYFLNIISGSQSVTKRIEITK